MDIEINQEALELSDEELDDIGYPALPLGDRTGYRKVAQAQLDKVLNAGYVKLPPGSAIFTGIHRVLRLVNQLLGVSQ